MATARHLPRVAVSARRLPTGLSASGSSEPETSQAARLPRHHPVRRARLDAIHVPWRWTLRRCIERGGDARPACVWFGWPTDVGPCARGTCQRVWVGHPRRVTLDDDVCTRDRDRDRTPFI